MNSTTITERINHFFYAPADYEGMFIQFLRIACALFIFTELAAIIFDFDLLFGQNGPIPHDIQQFVASKWSVSYIDILQAAEKTGMSQATATLLFLGLFVLALVFMAIGRFTRAAAITSLFFYVALTAGPFRYGVDLFVTIALFYLCIYPHSPDRTTGTKDLSGELQPLNFTPYKRFFQLNVCMIYFFAGLSKSISITWYNGEAVWKSINLTSSNHLFQIDFSILAKYPVLLTIMGIGILVVETLYPIAIWIRKYNINKIWLWTTIAMHLSIGIVLNLYFFAAFMIILNVSAFYFEFYEARSAQKSQAV